MSNQLSEEVASELNKMNTGHSFSWDPVKLVILIDGGPAAIDLYEQGGKNAKIVVSCDKPESNDQIQFPRKGQPLAERWVKPALLRLGTPPRKIAEHIMDKMFWQYLAQYADAVKLRDAHIAQEETEHHMAAELAGIVNTEEFRDNEIYDGGPGNGKGKVVGIQVEREFVNLDLKGIPFDIAKRMLTLWMAEQR